MAPVIDHRVAPTLDPFHTSERSQSKRRTEAFGAAFAPAGQTTGSASKLFEVFPELCSQDEANLPTGASGRVSERAMAHSGPPGPRHDFAVPQAGPNVRLN